MKKRFLPLLLVVSVVTVFSDQRSYSQPLHHGNKLTYADTLRGTITEERAWWDVLHYAISVQPDYNSKRLTGAVMLTFKVMAPGKRMQIDLQEPMNLSAVTWKEQSLPLSRLGNVFYVEFPQNLPAGSIEKINMQFSGNPVVAVQPPWDGGWIFSKDRMGRPWMTVACQGLGASVWFPCKDHQSDEPDSASMSITVPDTLVAVANGRLRSEITNDNGTRTFTWAVTNPINNYNLVPYIGKYVTWSEVYNGEGGALDCSYYVIDYNLDKAKTQFQQVTPMFQCFEHWFGPYPFYSDGFKLVESPHLGMEHQSAVAYGNGFRNGYRGTDLSRTGWGLKWDYIIIHESGHEWFGNNITTKDIADMWVHEGFTDYSETIYTQFQSGKDAGNAYVRGLRPMIQNEGPVIGQYGVNKEGSGDMYYKGANLIHYIRQFFKNDEQFRLAMREMNKVFYHTTTTSAEVEKFWSKKAGRDLSQLFNQYLRDIRIPILEYKISGKKISYRWNNTIPGYRVPVKVSINQQEPVWIEPETNWKNLSLKEPAGSVQADPDFYVNVQQLH